VFHHLWVTTRSGIGDGNTWLIPGDVVQFTSELLMPRVLKRALLIML
jgi:hypothetical protein